MILLRALSSRRLLACVACLLPALAAPAHAHLMPRGQGSIRVDKDAVTIFVAVPVAALTGFDDDGDGLMSADEANRHRAELSPQIDRLLQVFDGATPGRVTFEDFVVDPSDVDGMLITEHVGVMRRIKFKAPVQRLTMRVDTFEHAGAEDQQLTVEASTGERNDVAVFSPHRKEYRFFKSPIETLGGFVLVGAEHILLGFDHLLFLVTVLVAGAGWRYWFAVVTSFTVAHTVTLILAATGLVSAPARVTEAMIAASIVGMALDNLWRGAAVAKQRVVVVFACGLLHGLGFASALAELGLRGEYQWASLIGFNLGVETGQAAFVVTLLLAMAGAQALHRRLVADPLAQAAAPAHFVRASSVVAALIGSVMLVQRLL